LCPIESGEIMSDPCLYILMRNDLDSLTPGKGMAQAAHAACAFTIKMDVRDLYDEWWIGRQGFGTTVVLAASLDQIKVMVEQYAEQDKLIAGIVRDESYPVKDGAETYHIDIDTCGYIFCDREKHLFMNELELYP